MALVFWALVIAIFSIQWYISIHSRLDSRLGQSIRKCFLIFFDNTGFSLSSFFLGLAFAVVSVFLAFLFPGPAGVLLFSDEALRLRLLKYDWMEANPEEVEKARAKKKRVKIPWEVVLMDERERTGTRTFRNFIFPWKD
jgi:hypothetical protein